MGRRLAATIDETDELKKALRGAWRHWRYSRDNGAQLLDLQEARTAMGVESDELAERTAPPRLIEPQFIIESLLSNEWGRRHEPRGGEHKLPEIFLRSDSLGHPGIRDEYRKTFNFDESGGRFFKSSWEERLREGKREQ